MIKVCTCLYLLAIAGVAHAQIQKGSGIYGEAAGDESAIGLCMPDPNTVAIGAPYNDGNGSDAGHVRVYEWNGTSWTQKGADLDGEAPTSSFGSSVIMPDANTIAIGAQNNSGNGTFSGHVRVYSWDGNAWIQMGVDIDGEAGMDYSGVSVSMPDPQTVAIGAQGNDANGNFSGHVRVYSWNGSSWVQKGTDMDGLAAGDGFGASVDMPDPNTLAVGALGSDGNGSNSGQVRIFSWNGSSWVQKGTSISGEAAEDLAGIVSMPDSATLAIGSPFNDGNGNKSGHVRVYKWDGNNWIQKGTDIDGVSANENSGHSLSMPDANTLAVGAPNGKMNGVITGCARVFSWNGNAWVPTYTINGDSTFESAGGSLFMPDAATVAVGSGNSNGNGIKSGRARIFRLCNAFSSISPVSCGAYTSPSGKHTWTSGGSYFDTIPNAAGCDSIITIQLTIKTVNVTVTAQDSLLKADATNATYQWLDCDNAYAPVNNQTNQIFLPTDEGNYAVIVTQNGCSDTSGCISVWKVGLRKNAMPRVNLYPNPTGGVVVLDLGGEYKNVTLVIRDILGKELLSRNHEQIHTTELSLPWEKGCYFLEIITEDGQKVRLKVVRE